MIFSRIFGTKNTPGGPTIWPPTLSSSRKRTHRGMNQWATGTEGAPYPPGCAPLSCGPHVGPLHLFQHPSTLSSSRKNHHVAQTRVLAHSAVIFVLLAQSSIHKTALGDCSSVCDSSNGPISFCSSALFIAKNFCLGDFVLELACQIYEVPSNSNTWYRL